MAPVIWGLPLGEIKWSKFKSSYMWNNRYHLRRTKFIVYQLAMIFSVVGESLGTASLSDYLDEQKYAKQTVPGAYTYNNDYVGVFSFNIFAGVFVATVFGAGFFFDLFWPERREDHGIKLAWKWCAVAACIFQLAAAISTTVVLATHSATISGVTQEEADSILGMWRQSPLSYKHNARGVAGIVFTWLGFVFVVYATHILWKSYAHNDKYGPFAAHVRDSDDVEKYNGDASRDHSAAESNSPPNWERDGFHSTNYDGAVDDAGIPIQQPAPAHTQAPSTLGSLVEQDRAAEPNYNVATASTLNGTKHAL